MLFLTESLHTVIKTIFSSKLEYWKSWQCLDQYITCTCRLLFVSLDSFSIIISTRSDGIMKAKFRGLQGCNNLNQKSKLIHTWELRLNTYHLSLYIPHRVALTPLPLQMSMPLHFYWQIYKKWDTHSFFTGIKRYLSITLKPNTGISLITLAYIDFAYFEQPGPFWLSFGSVKKARNQPCHGVVVQSKHIRKAFAERNTTIEANILQHKLPLWVQSKKHCVAVSKYISVFP